MALTSRGRVGGDEKPKKRYAVMTYFHEISQNVRACAKTFGVDVVFGTDFKLGNLTPILTEKGCQKAHREKSVECDSGVVYEIPLECRFKYAGQTSKCLNDRLTEHKHNVKVKAPNSDIARHAQECNNCMIQWPETEVVHKDFNDMKKGSKRDSPNKNNG